MKYTRSQFDAVIGCIDRTIEIARILGKSSFSCLPLYTGKYAALADWCKEHCPLYPFAIFRKCTTEHDAAYWQFAKEKFIIENEQQD